MLNGGVLL